MALSNNITSMQIFLFIVLIFLASGCSAERQIASRQLKENQRISKIVLDSGREIDFTNDPAGCAFYRNFRIERFDNSGRIVYYELRDISAFYHKEIEVKTTSPLYWITSTLLGLLLGLIIIFSLIGPISVG